MASEKRCLYEVLGLHMDCTSDEIRSSYKKLALQRHPDKLMKSGLSQAEATAQFQELSHAYEVLSDPKERSWYDSHRSQILFSDPLNSSSSSNSVPNSPIPNLFSYFSNTVYSGYSNTNKGFYKVYYDLFNKVYLNEINYCKRLGLGFDSVREAPIMGDLESPYGQVTAFYNYWLGFSTVMDFGWVDQYDVMAGVNRKSRRVMEEENKKVRKKARREYNETVRGLAEFVKKRDKRVIDMAVRRKEEEERKKEEEKERKRKAERERMERLRAYEEPEWARVEEEEEEEMVVEEMDEEEEEGERRRNEGKELYCVVCSKKFKSEKQWKNHEQSKKHREKVAELRESFVDEDEEREEDFEEELGEDNVRKLGERFEGGLGIEEEEEEGENGVGGLSGDEEEEEGRDSGGNGDGGEDHDEEMSVLEAMVSGHKSRRKNVGLRRDDEDLTREVRVEDESEEEEVMEYNNRKSTRRNRGGKKERGKKNGGGDMKGDVDENKAGKNKENNLQDDSHTEESSLHSFVENVESNSKRDDDQLGKSSNSSNQTVDKRRNAKKDTKSKSSSKGKKAKATSKNSSNLCDTCGEEFQSRNKLHQHLGDTGHASLKFR